MTTADCSRRLRRKQCAGTHATRRHEIPWPRLRLVRAGATERVFVFMDYRDSAARIGGLQRHPSRNPKICRYPPTIQTAQPPTPPEILMPMDHEAFPAEGTVVCTLLELARDLQRFLSVVNEEMSQLAPGKAEVHWTLSLIIPSYLRSSSSPWASSPHGPLTG